MLDTMVYMASFEQRDFLTEGDTEYRLEIVVDGVTYKYSFTSLRDLEKFRAWFQMQEFFKWLREEDENSRKIAKETAEQGDDLEKVARDLFHEALARMFQQFLEKIYPPHKSTTPGM